MRKLYIGVPLLICARDEDKIFKTALCAVLLSEMSFCIISKSGDRGNGIFLTVAETLVSQITEF